MPHSPKVNGVFYFLGPNVVDLQHFSFHRLPRLNKKDKISSIKARVGFLYFVLGGFIMNDNLFFSAKDLAALLRVSPRTFLRWVRQGVVPPPAFRPNRRFARWTPAQVKKLIQEDGGREHAGQR